MPPQPAGFYLLEDLEDANKTRQLANGDLGALQAVSDWIKSFVARPHRDLGRSGPVCPFVPESLERRTLWLASERAAGRSARDLAELTSGYKAELLRARPADGDRANDASVVVVFSDLSADLARGLFADVLKQLAVPFYEEDGLVLGAFHAKNEGTAVHNRDFRPFMSPVPFLLLRHAVIGDWKFFLDDDDWLGRWAHRHGEPAVRALAEELRRLPWRARGDESDES